MGENLVKFKKDILAEKIFMPILDWFNKKEALKITDNTPYKVLEKTKIYPMEIKLRAICSLKEIT